MRTMVVREARDPNSGAWNGGVGSSPTVGAKTSSPFMAKGGGGVYEIRMLCYESCCGSDVNVEVERLALVRI